MITKLVLFTNGVETLEFFSKEMGKTFEKRGISLFYFNLKEPLRSTKLLKKFIKPHETAVVSFNFEGMEQEEGIYDKSGVSLWDAYEIPCYNIVVDHPMYYHPFLMQVPKNYYHISIDRTHENYMRRYYPEIRRGGFLPLAGTALSDGYGKDIKERSMDVIFTGNYTPPSYCDKFIYGINDEYAEFYMDIIHDLLEHPDKVFEDVMEEHCFAAMGENPLKDLRFTYSKSIFLDLYIRNFERGAVIKALADGGQKVHVFGKDWDKLSCEYPENIVHYPQTDSKSCLQAIGDAKLSLNVMPWFKDGAHDRIFNSMLNGAVSVTDGSIYLREKFTDQKELLFYDLLKLKELPQKVTSLLENTEKLQEIQQTGFEAAKAEHTWEVRAEQLLEMIELTDKK